MYGICKLHKITWHIQQIEVLVYDNEKDTLAHSVWQWNQFVLVEMMSTRKTRKKQDFVCFFILSVKRANNSRKCELLSKNTTPLVFKMITLHYISFHLWPFVPEFQGCPPQQLLIAPLYLPSFSVSPNQPKFEMIYIHNFIFVEMWEHSTISLCVYFRMSTKKSTDTSTTMTEKINKIKVWSALRWLASNLNNSIRFTISRLLSL